MFVPVRLHKGKTRLVGYDWKAKFNNLRTGYQRSISMVLDKLSVDELSKPHRN